MSCSSSSVDSINLTATNYYSHYFQPNTLKNPDQFAMFAELICKDQTTDDIKKAEVFTKVYRTISQPDSEFEIKITKLAMKNNIFFLKRENTFLASAVDEEVRKVLVTIDRKCKRIVASTHHLERNIPSVIKLHFIKKVDSHIKHILSLDDVFITNLLKQSILANGLKNDLQILILFSTILNDYELPTSRLISILSKENLEYYLSRNRVIFFKIILPLVLNRFEKEEIPFIQPFVKEFVNGGKFSPDFFDIMEYILRPCNVLSRHFFKKIGQIHPTFNDEILDKYLEESPARLLELCEKPLYYFPISLPESFAERVVWAQRISIRHPDIAVTNLLYLFDEEEITESTDDTFDKLLNHCHRTCKTKRINLNNVKMYLDFLMRNRSICPGDPPQTESIASSSASAPLPLTASSDSAKKEHLWEHLGDEPQSDGGNIKTFRLKNKFNPLSKANCNNLSQVAENLNIANKKLFPAVEPSISGVGTPQIYTYKAYFESKGGIPFAELGYRLETGKNGYYLSTPDVPLLQTRFDRLRNEKEYAYLPKLSFARSRGIASDVEFAKIHQTHDVLVSDDDEFLHDQLAHVVVILLLCELNSSIPGNYEKIRDLTRSSVAYFLDVIEKGKEKHLTEDEIIKIRLLEKSVGILVDLTNADSSTRRRIKLLDNWDNGILFSDTLDGEEGWRSPDLGAGVDRIRFPAVDVFNFWKIIEGEYNEFAV